MKYWLTYFLLSALFYCNAVAAQEKQEATGNDVAIFDDWRLACDQGQPCRIAQSVVQMPSRRLILQVKIFRGDDPTMLVSFPLGILLSTGWQYQIDGQKKTVLPFEICNSDGCHAGVKLTPTLVSALKRGRVLSITFRDAGQTEVNPQVSLIGFTKSYEALK